MRDHDLEPRNDLRKRNGSITLPCFQVPLRVDEDDEVLFLALEEDLGSGWCLHEAFRCSGRVFGEVRQLVHDLVLRLV